MDNAFKRKRLELMAAQTTTSGSNASTYGTVQKNSKHKGLMVFVPRTSDSGTCTMDVFLQALRPDGEETDNNDWFDITLGVVAQFADGDTGTYVGIIYPGITGQDTGTDAIATTSGAKVNATSSYLPAVYRLRLLSGGTTVTNTIGAITGIELP